MTGPASPHTFIGPSRHERSKTRHTPSPPTTLCKSWPKDRRAASEPPKHQRRARLADHAGQAWAAIAAFSLTMPPYVLGSHLSGSCAGEKHRPPWRAAVSRLAQYPLPFPRMRRCPLSHHSFKKTRRRGEEATLLHLFPLIMQPTFALSPLVVAVVLSSFSVMLMGFPVMCWQSSGSSLGLGRKKLHARRQVVVRGRA